MEEVVGERVLVGSGLSEHDSRPTKVMVAYGARANMMVVVLLLLITGVSAQ